MAEPDTRYSAVLGGLQVQNDASITNMQQAIGYPQQPAQFTYSLQAQPTINCGVVNSSTGVWTVTAISAIRIQNGEYALRVSTQGAVITMNAPAQVAVGAASTEILAANPLRRYAAISNPNATQTLTLTFGAAAVLNTGIVLQPGQTYEMSMGAGNLSTQQIRAIGSAVAAIAAVQEGV